MTSKLKVLLSRISADYIILDMHLIDDAIVQDGKLVLTDLPFAEGQHVQITVVEAPKQKRTIEEVRALLRGSVLKFDDPTEPMIPLEDWECLK